ncbi:heterokaryon incompatibility protein-domain-containing protein [Cladorrhinum sp. PSN259]|nr:heterokaryon incompatibility protein-domain-containing protein [Cladorrhinum sp. PSN259]
MAESGDGDLPLAKLCKSCQKGAFQDGGLKIKERYHDNGDRYLTLKGSRKSTNSPSHGISTDYILIDTFPDLPLLNESAHNERCDFCRFLRNVVLSRDVDTVVARISGKRIAGLGACKVSIQIFHDFKTWEKMGKRWLGTRILLIVGGFDQGIELRCVAEGVRGSTEELKYWLSLPGNATQSYSGEGYIASIQRYIGHCVSTHAHPLVDGSFVPARLLDVAQEPPRLVLRDELALSTSTVQYTALSYCWGTEEDSKGQLKTTTSTLPDRRTGIQESEMPAVLRDAIHVTRALSIPYLWIDALCILQDDVSDWEQQCQDMDKIYGNAYATLCAASSTSCVEGFLSQRGPTIRMPFYSQLQPNISGSYQLQFKYAIPLGCGVYWLSEAHQSTYSMDKEFPPWSQRGWVLQEQILSTRQVIFGNSNVHFVCGSCYGSVGSGQELVEGRYENLQRGYQTQLSELLTSTSQDAIYDWWASVLSSYAFFNHSSFTRISDMLPALAGLARAVQSRLNDEYSCGFWKRDLLRSLMWDGSEYRLKSVHLTILQRTTEVVPSWSRLLLTRYTESMVRQWELSRSHYNRVEDVRPEYQLITPEVTLAGANPFGQIRRASLHITTVVLDPSCLQMIRTSALSAQETPMDGDYAGFVWLSDFVDSYSETSSKDGFATNSFFLGSSVPNGHPATDVPDVQEYKWLLLGSYKKNVDMDTAVRCGDKEPRAPFGLIVHTIPSNPGKYWRVEGWKG